jgi:PAS domain S-box-containing protein
VEKILFYHGDEINREKAETLFRSFFPAPAELIFTGHEELAATTIDYDLAVFSIFPAERKDSITFPVVFKDGLRNASLLVITSATTIKGIPRGKSVVLFSDSASEVESVLPILLPGMSAWLDISRKNDTLFLDRQLTDHLLNNSRSMLSVINRDYIYERVNNKLCDIHSKGCIEIEGSSLSEIYGKEKFSRRIKPHIDKSFRGEVVKYEGDFEISPGCKRLYEVVFRPFHSLRGDVTHVIAETFDITELRNAEARFQKLSSEFKRFETNIPVGFVRCAPDGRIIHMNRACLDILGLASNKAVTGKNILDFYVDKTLFGVHVDQLMRVDSMALGRIYLRSADGREIACRITGFKQMHDKKEQFYLDFAIEDVTRELSLENRLLQAKRLESVGALAGGIAHDFNNLLTTIYGYAEMSLDNTEITSNHSGNLVKIINTVNRARSLINQVLTFSRQVEQEKIPVDVREVLRETMGYVTTNTPANVDIREVIPDKEAIVMADPTQLFRVFLNLLTNAVQAVGTSKGEVITRIDVLAGEQIGDIIRSSVIADNYVVVSVIDSGTGMEDSQIERIFEPFYTTREVGSGTGLGLSVSHGIISELGGEIVVDSEPGMGSRFRVFLPVINGIDIPSGVEFGQERALLFIAREAHESRLLVMALRSAGYKMDKAASATEVVRALEGKEGTYDLIIFADDIVSFSPADLLSLFKKTGISVPIIMITDSYDLVLEENVLTSESVRHFLIRPVSLREIKSAIELSVNPS